MSEKPSERSPCKISAPERMNFTQKSLAEQSYLLRAPAQMYHLQKLQQLVRLHHPFSTKSGSLDVVSDNDTAA